MYIAMLLCQRNRCRSSDGSIFCARRKRSEHEMILTRARNVFSLRKSIPLIPLNNLLIKRTQVSDIKEDLWKGKLGLEARSPSASKVTRVSHSLIDHDPY
jgi:hypothetical protein